MQPKNPNTVIALALVDEVVARIPEWAWPVVKDRLVNELLDAMPTFVIERLTGSPTNDDRAQEILDNYYKPAERNRNIIVDSFEILGEEQTLEFLEALQLDVTNEV